LVFWDSAFSLLICLVPTTENPSHYQELVTALSNKYQVSITVSVKTENNGFVEWLSKLPKDSEITVHKPPHLSETPNMFYSSSVCIEFLTDGGNICT
jgi:hypothetical protein